MVSCAHLTGRLHIPILALALALPSLAHAQSCSISISPQHGAQGQARTLSWSTYGSEYLTISNVGTVFNGGQFYGYTYCASFGNCSQSGSVTVYPSSNTTYSGSGQYRTMSCGFMGCTTTYYPISCSGTAYAYSAATCSVSLSPNPKPYGSSATLSWSSTNAHNWVYINNVGYVGSSGSISVNPAATTDYSCQASGYGGNGSQSAILTVTPPANCTMPWGGAVNHGSSVTAYQAATVPYGQSCASQTRTCTNGTLSGSYQYQSCNSGCSFNGSPVAHGASVTAYQSSVAPEGQTCAAISQSRTCSNGTLSGSYQYTSCTASCTPSYSCAGAGSQTITYTAADCTTTTITTCELPEFCAAGSAVCLYNAITGDITASPRLVGSGKTTSISWSTTDAESCTVTGTNGDTWTGTANSKTSSPITQVTTYTLQCDDADPDEVEDDFSDRVTVVRIPSWLEL